jgi:hypothetical protein
MHSLTSTRDGVEWAVSRAGRFIPRERTPVPVGYEAWWAPEPVWARWCREKFPTPAENRTPIVQRVGSRYTD